jgi:hypothetical protein
MSEQQCGWVGWLGTFDRTASGTFPCSANPNSGQRGRIVRQLAFGATVEMNKAAAVVSYPNRRDGSCRMEGSEATDRESRSRHQRRVVPC